MARRINYFRRVLWKSNAILGMFVLFVLCGVGATADWTTYRSDIARSGVTGERISPDLFLQWTYTPAHAPKPAWPLPAEELPRMHVDNAYYAVTAEGSVYFGSSVTDKVYAIDASKGEVRWTFFTQGPVRFAPTVYRGRIYVGSDDGYVYCLNSENGSEIWKYRPGPSAEKVIGNGRMISLWPVRTGVLVDDGTAYFAAGVFPYEGLYICALRADDGAVVWKNDTIGDYPHALEYGGISPDGYLVASKDILYVPSGRAMPAAFDRRTGKFLFYASPGAKRGGAWALLHDDQLIAGVDYSGRPDKVAYEAKTGRREGDVFAWFPGVDMVIADKVSYILTQDGVYAIDRAAYAAALKQLNKLEGERRQLGEQVAGIRRQLRSADDTAQKELNKQIRDLAVKMGSIQTKQQKIKNQTWRWKYAAQHPSSLILAGDILFVGGQNMVIGIHAANGKEVWRSPVEGRAVGLAASSGRLIVSTDQGPIYCFGETQCGVAKEIKPERNVNSYPNDDLAKVYRTAANKILAESDAQKGYALVLDCGEGRLTYALAKRTQLNIIGLEKDAGKRAMARKKLEQAGLLGARVVVEPWNLKDLPDYFANLVVSDGMLITGKTIAAKKERRRVLRPWGGVEYLGSGQGNRISWTKFVRGALKGAGSWTQQYADPQNTACSGDELVNGPLGILWFGEPGPQGVVERHARAQSPVSMNGLLFIEGEELVMGMDAFNGTILWRKEIPGAVRVKTKADSGNLVVTENGLYVAAHNQCYRLDPATGETIRIYEMPPSSDGKPRRWGYVSVVGNILYGSTAQSMREEYAAVLKNFLKNGKWRNRADIPQKQRGLYEEFKKQYPDPKDFRMASERGGWLYYRMASFGPGGEFTEKNAVTNGLMTSDKIFALDTESGKLLWQQDGKKIANITIALGDGKIYFSDNAITSQQRMQALKERRKLGKSGIYEEREGVLEELHKKKKMIGKKGVDQRALQYLIESLEAELFKEEVPEGSLTYDDADVRIVTALDAVTGKRIWRHVFDLTGCGGDRMGTAYAEGILFFFGYHGNHDAWRFREGGLKWRRITALDGKTGEMRWSRPLNYRTRPVIVGDKIIIEPRACDLRTGEILMRTHPITGRQVPWEFLRPGHTCAITAASAKGLFYRSACTAFYDLAEDRGVTLFGGYRPGCAISVIPAGGVLLSPEASAGCTCSYPIRCSMAMIRKPQRTQPWAVYVTPGALRPVKHFAINLGAPADMKDEDGTVWFAYPNPKTDRYTHFPNYGVKFDLQDKILPGMGYFYRDFRAAQIVGTDKPWLFTSGCRGLVRCELPLIDDKADQKPAGYTVRLGFHALPDDRPGQRVFDIKLQDKTVLKDCDIRRMAAISEGVVVKEFKNIRVEKNLVLELIPRNSQPKADEAPIINFIEVVREFEG